MKKTILTFAMLLGMSAFVQAQETAASTRVATEKAVKDPAAMGRTQAMKIKEITGCSEEKMMKIESLSTEKFTKIQQIHQNAKAIKDKDARQKEVKPQVIEVRKKFKNDLTSVLDASEMDKLKAKIKEERKMRKAEGKAKGKEKGKKIENATPENEGEDLEEIIK